MSQESHISLWFGTAIKRLRQLRGLTQKQLADTVGISQAYISKIEKGASHFRIHLDVIWGIAQALDVSLSTLFENAEQNKEL